MGYEQRVRLPSTAVNDLDAILRAQPAFADFDATYQLYNFRRHSLGGMPDVHAAIEPGGIYFCDNGAGAEVLGELLAALELRFGPLELEEV
jgi:hypothetical protein